MAYQRTYRKRKAPQAPYRRRRDSKPNARISQNGVGGAANSMTPKPMPPAQEVKTYDVSLSGTANSISGFAHILNLAATPQSPIAGIRVGAASSQRIGRQIRVVGVVLRGVINSSNQVTTEGEPYTMDVIWDSQSNGVLAPTNIIYDVAGGAGSIVNLPNANYAKRFTFIKRLELNGRAGIPTAQSIVNCTIKTNRLVNFDSDTGLTNDVEKNNLLLTFASVDPTATFTGVVRFLYVDA